MGHIGSGRVFEIATDPGLSESGGGHNQKGIEFQKHWGLLMMFQRWDDGADDFLVLFEAIQDIAILNAETDPTSIRVYQVKKKDRKEWSWTDLTLLHQPDAVRSKSLAVLKESPLGKLYATLQAFGDCDVQGCFISNMGCDLPLASGKSAATALSARIDQLAQGHHELFAKAASELGGSAVELGRVRLEKTSLPVNEPTRYLVGAVHQFLAKRSPRHAGQAQSLVESLLTHISPLGARTDICHTFDELRSQRGYSRTQLAQALADLEEFPDVIEHLREWLADLRSDGVSIVETTAIRMAATAAFRRQVAGAVPPAEQALIAACDSWLETAEQFSSTRALLDRGCAEISPHHRLFKRAEILAYIAIRAIVKCVDLTSRD